MKVDQNLINDCKKGNRLAQNRLYKKYYNLMMSVCFRYARDEYEATSLMNMGFLKILQNLDKIKPGVPFEAWLRRIMINSIIDNYRRNKKHREHINLMEFEDYNNYEGLVDYNEADRVLDTDQILGFINQLPPISKRVFNLNIIDGYAHKEIAEMLGIAEGTSKWHLSNARKILQGKILAASQQVKTRVS